MSLEQVIQEQTAAIAANTSALSALLAMWTAKPAANLTSDMVKAACAPLTKAGRTPRGVPAAEAARDKSQDPAMLAPRDTTPVTALTPEQQDAVRWADAEVRGGSTGTPAPAAVEPVAAVVVPEVVTPPAIEYPQVMKAITDTVKVDRQRAVDTLAKFNAKKGTELAPADYAAFLAALALGGAL